MSHASLPVAPLAHPAWCNPTVCDAQVDALPFEGGAHRSRSLTLDLGPFVPAAYRHPAVHLHLAVMPWPVEVYLIAVTGDYEVALPFGAAREQHTRLGALLARVTPPLDQDRPAAETATRHGSPATADDDYCRVHPDCYSVRWLGESDNAENVWSCDVSGATWRTKVRRPGNGVPFVLVIPWDADVWELTCLACGRDLRPRYPDEATAQAAADAHTADHERDTAGGAQ